MIKLTEHFTNEEMCVTSTQFPNVPTMENLIALTILCAKVLEPAREFMKAPLRVNSGYRNWAVNDAVKGSKTSQHMKGEAADITCYDNAKLFGYILKNLDFDQLIWEKGNKNFPAWVHVSYNRLGNNRKQVIYNY